MFRILMDLLPNLESNIPNINKFEIFWLSIINLNSAKTDHYPLSNHFELIISCFNAACRHLRMGYVFDFRN